MTRQHLIALIVACALFMELLDGSVIATALPQMARAFHENPVNLSVGMSAYLLTLAIFIPSSGWMADRFGAKTIFLSAIAIFTALVGLGAVVFRYLIYFVTWLATGHSQFGQAGFIPARQPWLCAIRHLRLHRVTP